ncbi:MAG: N-formylmethionyl-tRNA deformylase [Thermoleophilia bacterium]|nr:N-formylmethionyl-tRNA deformylase [Thermoleophilia bacterium]
MAVREVVQYPDERLKTECEPVGARHSLFSAAQAVAHDLLDTMATFPGCVGIAAPQIGELVRIVAIDVTGHKRAVSNHGRQILIDPVIVSRAGRVQMREGCLSIPDFTGNVTRAAAIVVEARDIDGAPIRLECDAYEARVVLHELDHLDGLLFLDRVAKASDVFPRKHYQ